MPNGFFSFLFGVDSFAISVPAMASRTTRNEEVAELHFFFCPLLCPKTSLAHHWAQKNEPCRTRFSFCFAEREGFEPPEPLSSTVFKTAAIDHSAISPTHSKHAFFKIGCKGTTNFGYTQIFCKKNVLWVVLCSSCVVLCSSWVAVVS